MTIHRYPDGVPERYRITGDFQNYFFGPKRREKEAAYAALSFTDRARELGVDTFHSGKGLAVEDFDRDGYLDIITGGFYDDDLRLYHNDHGKVFVDHTDQAGLRGFRQTHIMTTADYDNDGWCDLLVSRPWEFPLLLHNEKGHFVDVTTSMGLVTPEQMKEGRRWFTWAQAWADVDLDGDLDLFLTDMGLRAPISVMDRKAQGSRLYINEGTRFVDRTEEWGLLRWVDGKSFFGVAFGDEDGDGYPELFVSSPTTHSMSTTMATSISFRPVSQPLAARRNAACFTRTSVSIAAGTAPSTCRTVDGSVDTKMHSRASFPRMSWVPHSAT
jgi:FG-GAP-like repeat